MLRLKNPEQPLKRIECEKKNWNETKDGIVKSYHRNCKFHNAFPNFCLRTLYTECPIIDHLAKNIIENLNEKKISAQNLT